MTLQKFFNGSGDLIERKIRLHEIRDNPKFLCLFFVRIVAQIREYGDRYFREGRLAAQLLQKLEARHAGQYEVEHDEVRLLFARLLETLLRIHHRIDFESFLSQLR